MDPHRPALLAFGLALGLSGCGRGSPYVDAPPPPAPIVVGAAITRSGVSLSPDHFGAGLVQLVVTNLTAGSQQLTLASTGGRPVDQQTGPINPDGTAQLKAQLDAGTYTVSVADPAVRGARLAVGPPRPPLP